MKVLHLSSEASWRGGEQQIAYLITELQKLNVDVMVACKKGSPFEDFCIQEHIPYKAINFSHQYAPGTALKIKNICNEFQADILHMHSSKSHGAGVIATLLGAKANLVLSRRVDFPVKQGKLSQFKYNFDGIKRIICVSDAIKDITARGIKDSSKLVTVHSGIDIDKFHPESVNKSILHTQFNIPTDKIIIGNTSALAPHKDYFTFINTADILLKSNKNLHFCIIGKGKLKGEIENYIQKKQLTENFTLTGFINNIPDVLPALDLFLMTSETEGLGTSILDAFASKVPVVATAAGGIPEMVIHKKTGMIAPIKDVETLAKNVKEVFADLNLQKDIVSGAFKHLHSFSKEQTALKTLEIYKQILSEKAIKS
ncbi:glycosyltransferase family 4 protein [Chondrinema litorale]|uniref:glycosyltransferase family 4 protein n=1 Tax=Chondrinema litorale TaxID=2994555 RepID=UPI002542D7BB|nr:glycosyltransferase family 4 protein [Chondrinema litorale]UZR95792.1 glycosyltransferase family 4 protein [Chondrinema litorale]